LELDILERCNDKFNAKKIKIKLRKAKNGEKIGSLYDPLACNLPLVKSQFYI
jgi:hypothetical protein